MFTSTLFPVSLVRSVEETAWEQCCVYMTPYKYTTLPKLIQSYQQRWKNHFPIHNELGIPNRNLPNLLECRQNNSMKLRRAMLTATKQWFILPVLISCYCFVCTQANSGSVYWECHKHLSR